MRLWAPFVHIQAKQNSKLVSMAACGRAHWLLVMEAPIQKSMTHVHAWHIRIFVSKREVNIYYIGENSHYICFVVKEEAR